MQRWRWCSSASPEAINPAFALAPPLIGAIEIDTERDEERLSHAKLHKGCD